MHKRGFPPRPSRPGPHVLAAAAAAAAHLQGAGSVCLDVINQTWSPMFDLVNVFETFLPQVGAAAAAAAAVASAALFGCCGLQLRRCCCNRSVLPMLQMHLDATCHFVARLPSPQLLLYPNPSDPLNGEAAALHMRDPGAYQKKVGAWSLVNPTAARIWLARKVAGMPALALHVRGASSYRTKTNGWSVSAGQGLRGC